MSNKTTFIVKKTNKNKNGGYVWTLSADIKATAFGLDKTIKRTFYIGGMPQDVAIGHKLEEDLSRFDIVERKVAMVDDGTGKKTPMDIEAATKQGLVYEIYNLKWLHIKAA